MGAVDQREEKGKKETFDSGGLLGELLHLPLCNPPSSRRARNARKEGAPLPCPGEVNTWPSDRNGRRIDKKMRASRWGTRRGTRRRGA